MLALFSKKVANAPSELDAPVNESPDGRRSAAAILDSFRKAHPLATVVQFDDVTAFAFSHDDQELLRPRSLGVVEDIFCMFKGNLENLPQLRQQYGLSKAINETSLVIEMYRSLRDRAPYPADQVVKSLHGHFIFLLFDSKTQSVFVAADAHGKVEFYWGTSADGAVAFSDDRPILKESCGKSLAPFPQGFFFSSAEGLQSFEHPLNPVQAMPRVDSQGQMCGATFKADKKKETPGPGFAGVPGVPRVPRVGSDASWTTAF